MKHTSLPPQHPLHALSWILSSLEAVRNGRALFLLLGTFSFSGLLLAMAETSLAKGTLAWAVVQGGAMLFVVFYGGYAAGLVLMDETEGRPVREVEQALRDAFFNAHRLVALWLSISLVVAVLVAAVAALLWLSRVELLGTWLGALVFGLTLPAGVVVMGLALLGVAGVAVPLSGPALWAGMSLRETVALVIEQIRYRLLALVLLTAAVTLLSTAMAAVMAFGVFSGARLLAVMAVLVTGVDIPVQQLMAGFFGYGLRSLGASGAPAAQTAHGAAALIGGGAVFALALVLPVLVYLRGLCAVFIVVRPLQPRMAPDVQDPR
jgi:hypothetical protein